MSLQPRPSAGVPLLPHLLQLTGQQLLQVSSGWPVLLPYNVCWLSAWDCLPSGCLWCHQCSSLRQVHSRFQECPAMFSASIVPLGWTWHGSLCKSSPSEGPGVAAVHSSNSDWALRRESQRKTRGVFSEKKCHCSHLLRLTLSWSCSKHCPCVSSFKLPTYHRRWGHPHFSHSHPLGELPPLPRSTGLVSVQPGSNPGSLFPETCF